MPALAEGYTSSEARILLPELRRQYAGAASWPEKMKLALMMAAVGNKTGLPTLGEALLCRGEKQDKQDHLRAALALARVADRQCVDILIYAIDQAPRGQEFATWGIARAARDAGGTADEDAQFDLLEKMVLAANRYGIGENGEVVYVFVQFGGDRDPGRVQRVLREAIKDSAPENVPKVIAAARLLADQGGEEERAAVGSALTELLQSLFDRGKGASNSLVEAIAELRDKAASGKVMALVEKDWIRVVEDLRFRLMVAADPTKTLESYGKRFEANPRALSGQMLMTLLLHGTGEAITFILQQAPEVVLSNFRMLGSTAMATREYRARTDVLRNTLREDEWKRLASGEGAHVLPKGLPGRLLSTTAVKELETRIDALGDAVGKDEWVRFLLGVIEKGGSGELQDAARVLGKLQAKPAVPLLAATLQRGRRPAADCAAALGEIGGPEAVKALLSVASNAGGRDYRLRIAAIRALGAAGDSSVAAALCKVPLPGGETEEEASRRRLADEQSEAIAAASEALARLGPKSVPVLVDTLKSESPLRRQMAARALAGIGAVAAKALVGALAEKGSAARTEVIEALAKIGEPAVPDLVTSLEDEAAAVREGAVTALVAVGSDAVDPLLAVLKHKSPEVRKLAILALGKLRDKRALEPLKQIAEKDPDQLVRSRAGLAVIQISREK